MRKILGLATSAGIAAAVLLSGLPPALAAPGMPAAPALAAAALTGVTPSATPTPKPTPTPTPKPTPPPAPPANDPFVAQLIKAINAYRAANGAGPLVVNRTIGAGSQQWAVTVNGRINAGTLDMAKVHRTDAGLSILPPGADMYSEIIAINYTPQQVVDWWMGSAPHRAALLDRRATDIGLGYVKTTKAGWGGMTVVVGNLAGYPASRAKQPQPAPVPVAKAGDVAVVDTDGGLYVYPSARGGDLWQRRFVSNGWSAAQQLVVCDYDGDGRQDIVTVWKSGALTVSYGRADGTLAPARTIGSGWGAYDLVVSRWRTGDRLPSVVAKNRTTGELFLYPNLDGARFAARTKIGSGWGPLTIIGADFDGDGRQDLLARNGAGQLLLYRGTGQGGFVSEARRVIGTGWGGMTFLSGITNHLGDGRQGVLARTASGNLIHYPILKNGWGAPAQIGTGGWEPLLLGS